MFKEYRPLRKAELSAIKTNASIKVLLFGKHVRTLVDSYNRITVKVYQYNDREYNKVIHWKSYANI